MRTRVHAELATNSPDKPAPEPKPEIPPPNHPSPDVPKPGDPPARPRPTDPPTTDPQPDRPGPVRPQAVLGLATLLLLLLAGSSFAQQPPGESIDDNDILEAVETELRNDDAVSADVLDVTVDDGIVTLSGNSFTLLAKRRAVALIGALKGVRAVVNRVEVSPGSRSDEQILPEVQAALRDDPVADQEKIQVTVERGAVKLAGTVASFPERQLVETTVAGVRGVTAIDNQIMVLEPTARRDNEIEPEVLRRIQLSPYLSGDLIDVKVKDAVVTLSGAVGSLNERAVARFLSWVPGVQDVDVSKLQVQWWAKRDLRRDKVAVMRNDVQLNRAVEDALLYDPRVRREKIKVRVRQGAVSLLGNVSSLSAKRAAERDAKNTLGVRRVINHLKVKTPDWPGDAEVTQRVQRALARDAHLTNFDLNVTSNFGKVYVTGEVHSHFEKQRAETVIANVYGVLSMVNRISVDAPWQRKPDSEIREDVERRLSWSPWLDTAEIRVTVEGGAATLRGTVDTWQQRQAARRHAFLAGARRVINELDVPRKQSTELKTKPAKTK